MKVVFGVRNWFWFIDYRHLKVYHLNIRMLRVTNEPVCCAMHAQMWNNEAATSNQLGAKRGGTDTVTYTKEELSDILAHTHAQKSYGIIISV